MSIKETLKTEAYVALHAQTWTFRIVKYIILCAIAASVYWWKGWPMVGKVFLGLFVFAIAMHFFFRYMSDGWTRSRWLYKNVFHE